MTPTPPKKTPIDECPADLLELANAVYDDYIEAVKTRSETFQPGALVGLGFKDWIIGGQGYLSPSTVGRRERIMAGLSGKPYHGKLAQAGLFGHPRYDAGTRIEYLKPYVEIDDDGQIHWGLREGKDRDLLFNWKYDRVTLRVMDGGDYLPISSASDLYDNVDSLSEMGLTDDDYRFVVGCEASDGTARMGKYFDWAIVDGKWQEIEYQGRDWDGEYEA